MIRNEVNERDGWTLRANTTVAKLRKAEIRGKVANYEQKVVTGNPSTVREEITKNTLNSKVDVEYAHNIKVFDKEELKPLTNGILKSHHVAIIQDETVGDSSNTFNPVETYDNTQIKEENPKPSVLAQMGLDNAETGEKAVPPVSKEGFFLKNMIDDVLNRFRSHEEGHVAKEVEERQHRNTVWVVVVGVAILSAVALVVALM